MFLLFVVRLTWLQFQRCQLKKFQPAAMGAAVAPESRLCSYYILNRFRPHSIAASIIYRKLCSSCMFYICVYMCIFEHSYVCVCVSVCKYCCKMCRPAIRQVFLRNLLCTNGKYQVKSEKNSWHVLLLFWPIVDLMTQFCIHPLLTSRPTIRTTA